MAEDDALRVRMDGSGAGVGVGAIGQVHPRTLTAAGWSQPAGRGRYEVPAVRIGCCSPLMTADRR